MMSQRIVKDRSAGAWRREEKASLPLKTGVLAVKLTWFSAVIAYVAGEVAVISDEPEINEAVRHN